MLKIPEKVSGFPIHVGSLFFDEYIINRRFRLQNAMFLISFGRFLVFGPSWHGRCNMSCEPHEKLTNQPKPTLRRIIMLNIKDLAVSKSLDHKEMSAVRGGANSNSSLMGGNSVAALGGFGPTTAVGIESNTVVQSNVAPVTKVQFDSYSFGYPVY
jgi:hypothetical protein